MISDWAENLLDRTRLEQAGYMDADPIRKKWEEHLCGARNWHYYLWDILMFEAGGTTRGLGFSASKLALASLKLLTPTDILVGIIEFVKSSQVTEDFRKSC